MQDVALKILLVEDNDALREATMVFLEQQGHCVRGVAMSEDIDDMAAGFFPDVYVIDLNLPDEDGLALTKRLREAHSNVGIIITTARSQIGDKVLGYKNGADLYLTKPVHPQELLASLISLGNRLRVNSPQLNSLLLDLSRMQLSGPQGILDLTSSDAQILSALTRAPGQKLERWQIAEVVSSSTGEPPSVATIEMRITRLRKKLAATGVPAPHIKAIHKVGYALCVPVIFR